MTPRQDLLFTDLPADAAHRFRAVAEIIRRHGAAFADTPTLLDVGGYPCTFARRFMEAYPRWRVTTVDQPDEPLEDYRRASALELPFPDKSFDAVCSVDVLEHIEPKARRLFLTELCRVSRSLVVVAAPFHHPATARVEESLNNAHKALFAKAHPWLGEHVENGLPTHDAIFAAWPDSHGIVEAHRSYPLERWLLWQYADLARKARAELDSLWPAFDRAASASAVDIIEDANEIAYRTTLVGVRGERGRIRHQDLSRAENDGDRTVELARLLTRLLTVTGTESIPSGPGGEIPAINERLAQALEAAEGEIRTLRAGGGLGMGHALRRALRRLAGRR